MVGHKTIGVAEPIEIRDHPADDIHKHALIGIIEVYQASSLPRAITLNLQDLNELFATAKGQTPYTVHKVKECSHAFKRPQILYE